MAKTDTANSRKVDYYMSEVRDFPKIDAAPRVRYLLCSSPRCGSTLIGQMLYDTQLAGDPLEYFNERYLASYLRQKKATSGQIFFDKYLQEMESRRTSPNGLFGMQLHFQHLTRLLKGKHRAAIDLLRKQDRIILLRRKNKIAQAVSLYRAIVTDTWSSLDVKFRTPEELEHAQTVAFDASRIANTLANIIAQDTGWESLLREQNLPFIEIYYEDFIANHVDQCQRILNHLGLLIDPEMIPAPQLQRQSDDNDTLIESFTAYINAGSHISQTTLKAAPF